LTWLLDCVDEGRFREPAPIGFYFAKLWYFERLYPLVWIVSALKTACRSESFGTFGALSQPAARIEQQTAVGGSPR
jgi:hypothetical protein